MVGSTAGLQLKTKQTKRQRGLHQKGAHPLRTIGTLLVGRIAGWRYVITRSFDRPEKVAYVRRRWRVAEMGIQREGAQSLEII